MAHLVPAAEQLLRLWLKLAQDVVGSASPQEQNAMLEKLKDRNFERALRGIKLLSVHHPKVVAAALISWRAKTQQEIKESLGISTQNGVCKRAALELVGFVGAYHLLDSYTDESFTHNELLQFFDQQCHFAFSWLVLSEKHVPFPELAAIRQLVVERAAKLLGVMSRIRLPFVQDLFLRELDLRLTKPSGQDYGPRRAEIIRLCAGMRCVSLQFENDVQLNWAIKFLRSTAPLQHVAPIKKSQVHHALCEMLTNILTPLVRADLPHSATGLNPRLLQDWYTTVLTLRKELHAWVNKQNKHVQVGYPLLTLLVCLSDDDNYPIAVETMSEIVLKALKTKEYRVLALRCMQQLVYSYLKRFRNIRTHELNSWLDRNIKPILNLFRKNALSEYQESLVQLCTLVAEMYPKYAISSILLELLQSDNPEIVVTALQVLHRVLGSPQQAAAAANSARSNNVGSSTSSLAAVRNASAHAGMALNSAQSKHREALDLMRRGQHPLDHPDLTPLLHSLLGALSKVHLTCYTQYGGQTTYSGEVIPKEKLGGIPALTWLLQLMPYVKPEQWPSVVHPNLKPPIDALAKYTANIEGQVRMCACGALQDLMRGSPAQRKAIISSVSLFIAELPDDHSQCIGQGLQLLRNLLEDWYKITVEHITGQFSEPARGSDLQLDLAVTEGVLLMLLCHLDPSIRREALDLIGVVRALHQQLRLAAATSKGHARTKSSDFHNQKRKLQNLPVPGIQIIHQNSSSMDISEFVEANGLAELPGEQVVYAMDVIEEVANDAAKRYYWDFGDQSDLLREWKDVNRDATFRTVLTGDGEELSKLRWSRLLAATIQAMSAMCRASAYVGHIEVMGKLGKLLVPNNTGRLCLPEDSRRVELWRNYAAFALACPDHAARGEKPHALSKRRGYLASQRDLVRVVMAALAGSREKWVLQQSCILVLGNAHHDHLPFVFEELNNLQDDIRSTKTKTKSKVDEGRVIVANICRVAACNLPPVVLSENQVVRARYLELLRDSYTTLRGLKAFSEEFWDNYQLAYCLCSLVQFLAPFMVKELSLSLGSLANLTPRRVNQVAAQAIDSGSAIWKLLYELLASWCEEGNGPGQGYRNTVVHGINHMLTRDKDMDTDAVRKELLQKAGFLDSASRMAMAAILKGAELDSDAKRAEGPVLSWIDRLFAAEPRPMAYVGPSLHMIARTALLNLLEKNPDIFNKCIDRCYSGQEGVSTGYFAVLSEVYALYPVKCEQHILLSLILFKMVDPSVEVREDALHMLQVLCQREWMGNGGDDLETPSIQTSHLGTTMDELTLGGSSDTVVVMGTLQDSYQKFQAQLSEKLARDHPELSEELCEEMMTRQLRSTQHPVLSCLLPWMRNLVISPHWKGNWCERLLKSMYLVTKEKGHQFPVEIQNLWTTVAGSRRNIIPILEFLITFGIQTALQEQGAMQEFFSVGKRISLYLSNVNPQQTIDHLVFEIMQQKNEEEPASLVAAAPGLDVHTEFTSLFNAKAAVSAHDLMDMAPGERSRHGSFNQLPDLFRKQNMDLMREMSRHTHSDSASSRNSVMMQQIQQSILEATSLPPLASMSTKPEEPILPSSPTLRALMTRGELALCLLAEIAYQHDQDFESHLALLLHSAVVGMDSEEVLVASHCQSLLINLLYSLSAHHMEEQASKEEEEGEDPVEVKQAMAVIKHIQSMKGQKLWAYEDVTLKQVHLPSSTQLNSMVRCLVEALYFERELCGNWGTLALQWSLECKSRHVACRSLQVYRALQPALNTDCCNLLLVSLQQCFVHRSAPSLHCAVEMLLTLQVLVSLTPSNKLVLYPQLFWSTVTLLQTNYVHLFSCVLELLSVILRHCQLHDPWVQNVMLAACPAPASALLGGGADGIKHTTFHGGGNMWEEQEGTGWKVGYWLAGLEGQGGEEILALQQVVLKGLLFEDTEMLSIRVMSQLAHQLALCSGSSQQQPHQQEHQPNSTIPSSAPDTITAEKLRCRSLPPQNPSNLGSAFTRTESHKGATGSGIGVPDPSDGGAADFGGQQYADRRESGTNATVSGGYDDTRQHQERKGGVWRGCWQHTRRRKKREVVLEALIGRKHSQLFVSIFGMLPFLCTFSTIPAVSVAALEAVQECMTALASACEACGLPVLAIRVALLGHVRSASLPTLLANLAVPFTEAFFPTYARWFLRACIGLLNTPGRPALHQHVLLLLKCVFEVEGLQLGSALQLVADSSLFDPLVALAQGPNSAAALEALGAMVSFAQSSSEVAQFISKDGSQCYPALHLPPDPLEAAGASMTCLTVKDATIAEVLERILQAAGAHISPNQKQRLMPYLAQYAIKANKTY